MLKIFILQEFMMNVSLNGDFKRKEVTGTQITLNMIKIRTIHIMK